MRRIGEGCILWRELRCIAFIAWTAVDGPGGAGLLLSAVEPLCQRLFDIRVPFEVDSFGFAFTLVCGVTR